MSSTEGIDSKAPIMTLPNELFLEVASHLKSFKFLNSFVRTSRFFHAMLNSQLYRRAVIANYTFRHNIVVWVLNRFRVASLSLLLDNGLSVDHTGPFGYKQLEETMLFFLCRIDYNQERSVPLARLLIQRGAEVKANDSQSSKTLLHVAVRRNKCGIAAALLEHHDDIDVNAMDDQGKTLLHHVSPGGTEMMELLIAHGAAVDARTRDGDTPLLLAIEKRDLSLIPMLLAHGADAGVHNNRGETPLHRISTWLDSRHYELAKSLLEHGANVDAIDLQGQTPLHYRIAFGTRSTKAGPFVVKFLLENGADVNAISNDGLSPLQRILSFDCTSDVVSLLLEHGADISMLNSELRRLLSRGSCKQHQQALK
jgi:ankyrin repeat protein